MGSALAALGMKYSRPPSLLRSSSVPVSCVMGWMAAQGCCPPPFLSFSVFHSSRRTDGRAQSADGLNCSIFRYGPTLRTDGRVDGRITWSVDVLWACGVGGGDDQKDQRTMKTLGRDIVGGSLSLSILVVVAALRIRFIRAAAYRYPPRVRRLGTSLSKPPSFASPQSRIS